MKLIEKISSQVDKTVKYIFQDDAYGNGCIFEASYINKDDGKDIICTSTHFGCRMGCKFCHLSDYSSKVSDHNIFSDMIYEAVKTIYADQGFDMLNMKQMLLVSYMGCGEPLNDFGSTVDSMSLIRRDFQKGMTRFAIATMLPKNKWTHFFSLADDIKYYDLKVKIHLSLHFVDDKIRSEWMPMALDIRSAISALEFYKNITGNSVEIHYALMKDVNDSLKDAVALGKLLDKRDIPVKILKYNEKDSLSVISADEERVAKFRQVLTDFDIINEYYDPPGRDIGSSCGAFMMDKYLKYNSFDTKASWGV